MVPKHGQFYQKALLSFSKLGTSVKPCCRLHLVCSTRDIGGVGVHSVRRLPIYISSEYKRTCHPPAMQCPIRTTAAVLFRLFAVTLQKLLNVEYGSSREGTLGLAVCLVFFDALKNSTIVTVVLSSSAALISTIDLPGFKAKRC